MCAQSINVYPDHTHFLIKQVVVIQLHPRHEMSLVHWKWRPYNSESFVFHTGNKSEMAEPVPGQGFYTQVQTQPRTIDITLWSPTHSFC